MFGAAFEEEECGSRLRWAVGRKLQAETHLGGSARITDDPGERWGARRRIWVLMERGGQIQE